MSGLRSLTERAYEEEICDQCEPALRERIILRASALRADLDRLLRRVGADIRL